MDNRRFYGLRAPRPIGYSTFLVPQLENYSLFASPFMDLSKKLRGFFAETQKDAPKESEETETKPRKGKTKSEDCKTKVAEKKLSEETGQADDSFGIVLNVVTVKPEDLVITFGDGEEIEVQVNQSDVKLSRMDITFSRNCSYKYQLPDGVTKDSLVALRTSDDYLIILQRDSLRKDLLSKSIKIAKEVLAEYSDEEMVKSTEQKSPDLEGKETEPKASGSEEIKPKKGSGSEEIKPKKGSGSEEIKPKKGSGSEEIKPKKGSGSEEIKPKKGSGSEEIKPKKGSKSKVSESDSDLKEKGKETQQDDETADVFSESETEFKTENGLKPVNVCRILRPGMDIFMLRKYMVDLESYVSTVRNFIENASFITQNSKTPEIWIRALANDKTDEFFEKQYKQAGKKNIVKDPTAESGYTSADKLTPETTDESSSSAADKLTPETTDESSSSSTKSGEPSQETPEE